MNHLIPLSWIYWDPPKEAFTIPGINLSVAWYGILFAVGFLLAYWMIIPIFRQFILEHHSKLSRPAATAMATQAADTLMLYAVIGTVIGARLGHMLFYDFSLFIHHPLEFFMIRHGGLASHGGTVGVMIAIIFFLKRIQKKSLPELTYIDLLDIMVIPTAIVACCIRLGNFINQEILGTATSLPWGIIFGHPGDASTPIPRHPAQLYEALLYAATFAILFTLWYKAKDSLKKGTLSGLFFIFVFGGRFLIEFVKEPQGGIFDESFLQVGQYLSIPFILLGIYLLCLQPKKTLR